MVEQKEMKNQQLISFSYFVLVIPCPPMSTWWKLEVASSMRCWWPEQSCPTCRRQGPWPRRGTRRSDLGVVCRPIKNKTFWPWQSSDGCCRLLRMCLFWSKASQWQGRGYLKGWLKTRWVGVDCSSKPWWNSSESTWSSWAKHRRDYCSEGCVANPLDGPF